MKLKTFLLFFVSAVSVFSAQTLYVNSASDGTLIPTTPNITVPSGKSVTVASGAVLTVASGGSINIPAGSLDVTDVTGAAPSSSPTFTGTPILPTGTIVQIPGGFPVTTVSFGSTTEFASPVIFSNTVDIGDVTSTEISYMDGVTSAIQPQINAKAPLASPTFTTKTTTASTAPRLVLNDTNGVSGEKLIDAIFDAGSVSFRSRNDADSATTLEYLKLNAADGRVDITAPVLTLPPDVQNFTNTTWSSSAYISIQTLSALNLQGDDSAQFGQGLHQIYMDNTDGIRIEGDTNAITLTAYDGPIRFYSTDTSVDAWLTLEAGALLFSVGTVPYFGVGDGGVGGTMVVNTFHGDSDRLISTNGDGQLDISLIPTTDIVVAIQRGTNADRLLDTPDAGVLVWTTDSHEAWIGEASTVGGIPFTPPGYEFAPGGDEDHINITTPDSVSNMYLGTQTFEINMVSDHLTWADGVSFTLDSAEINLVVGSHSIYITEDTSGMTGDTLSLNAPGIGQIQINGDAGVTIESEVGYEVNLSSSESIALNGPVFVNGALRLSRVTTATSYTIIGTDYLIAVTNTASARTVNLSPAATTQNPGRHLVIKDESGGAGTNNITIDPDGSELIDGAATKSITTNYGVMRIYCNGTAWFTE